MSIKVSIALAVLVLFPGVGATQEASIPDLADQSVCEFIASEMTKPRNAIVFPRRFLSQTAAVDLDDDGVPEQLELAPNGGTAGYITTQVNGELNHDYPVYPASLIPRDPSYERRILGENGGFFSHAGKVFRVLYDDRLGERITEVIRLGDDDPKFECAFDVMPIGKTKAHDAELAVCHTLLEQASGEQGRDVITRLDIQYASRFMDVRSGHLDPGASLESSSEPRNTQNQPNLWHIGVGGYSVDDRKSAVSVDFDKDGTNDRFVRVDHEWAGGPGCVGQFLLPVPDEAGEAPTVREQLDFVELQIATDTNARFPCHSQRSLLSKEGGLFLQTQTEAWQYNGPRRILHRIEGKDVNLACSVSYRFQHDIILDRSRGIFPEGYKEQSKKSQETLPK